MACHDGEGGTILSGTRIIEVEGIGPGPFAGMMLADMGADVIKVDRPGGHSTPGLPDAPILDRGKRSIELDLKSGSGRDVFLKLVATADGLIEGFRPGVMEQLGIGPQECHAVNPALIYGRMTGWGQEGPNCRLAGHDMNYIGLSGALWYGGMPGQEPMAPATLIGDIGGGALYLVAGMLAGLLQARSTGAGTVVDAAIFDGSAHMMNLLMTLGQGGGLSETRGQSLLDGPHWCRTYRCQDGGFISVQCLEPKFYAIFLDRLGLSGDAEFQKQFDKSQWPVLADRLEVVFASKPRDAWAGLFAGTDACVAPVLTPYEAASHPLNAARKAWVEVDGVLQAAPAPRFAGREAKLNSPPVRGGNKAEILAELGLDESSVGS